MQDSLWLWCDLEMTGLSEDDTILEVGAIITTPELQVITAKPFHKVIHHSKNELDQMSEWCIENHQLSGLTDAVLESKDSLSSVEQDLITFIRDNSLETDVIYLAGNSIHTDRAFIKKYMPGVESMLHYRMVDVTSIGMFLETLGIKRYEKASTHRACDDIVESIEELKYYTSKIPHDN